MKDAKPKFDVVAHNRSAWDRQVEGGNIWTLPVTPEQVARARGGDWSVLLTETKPVPASWFPLDVGGRFLPGVRVLCLASGGGQQGPILSAAGAIVTVFDNSPRQLERDRMVAERDGLRITTVQGDMIDLSAFADESFDLVFHPVSNVFSAEVLPVYREAYRVLIRGGTLLAGFMNPDLYILDMAEEDIRVVVDDDGKGFAADMQSESSGIGLKVIRERVGLLGGEFKIDSKVGQGTRVSFQVPAITA